MKDLRIKSILFTNNNLKNEVKNMQDLNGYTTEMRAYFEALPDFINESIIISDVQLHTKDELAALAKNLLDQQPK